MAQCNECVNTKCEIHRITKENEELKNKLKMLEMEWRFMKYDLSNAKMEIETLNQKLSGHSHCVSFYQYMSQDKIDTNLSD